MRRIAPIRLSAVRPIRKSCQGSIWLTSDADGATEANHDMDLLKSPAKKRLPPLLFPWRHDNELPKRLIDRRDCLKDTMISYETSAKAISMMTAAFYFNNVTFFRLFGSGWKFDLAESCSWAFFETLASILSKSYQVPPEKVAKYNQDGDIALNFHHTAGAKEDEENKEADSNDKAVDDNQLFEPKLCKLFQGARHSGKEQLEVFLESTPTSAELHSLHALPALSRSLVESHPALVRELYDARASGTSALDSKIINKIMAETGKVKTTIFADVLVHCDERFWVKDVESGAIVQGNGDGKVRQVLHTLRLERHSTFVPGQGRHLEDWLITDVDDLLEGNRWFDPPAKLWWLAD